MNPKLWLAPFLLVAASVSAAWGGRLLQTGDAVTGNWSGTPEEWQVREVSPAGITISRPGVLKKIRREDLPAALADRLPLAPVGFELAVERHAVIRQEQDKEKQIVSLDLRNQFDRASGRWSFNWAISAYDPRGHPRGEGRFAWARAASAADLRALFTRFLAVVDQAKPGVPLRVPLSETFTAIQIDDARAPLLFAGTENAFTLDEVAALQALLTQEQAMLAEMAEKVRSTQEQQSRMQKFLEPLASAADQYEMERKR